MAGETQPHRAVRGPFGGDDRGAHEARGSDGDGGRRQV
jgi:hypothetical protein